ncbi:MAG: hypothetical protein WDO19_14835 [Bacteroidota bacterium]
MLTQKVAGGLYLHNWLHGSGSISLASHDDKVISQYNCTCIDDFYVPFTEPLKISLPVPFPAQADFSIVRELALPVVAKYFHSLRAPPVS